MGRRRGARTARRVIAVLAITLGGAGTAGLFAAPTAVAAGHSVSITPSSDLGQNQFIKITWSGYSASQVVGFRQCTASPTTVATDCTAFYDDLGYSDSTGGGTIYEQTFEGDVTSQSGGTFTCDESNPCTFGVFTDGTLNGVLTPITYAPAPSDCPSPTGTPISGDGSDEANQAIYNWTLQMCEPPVQQQVGYISQNSIDGRENFIHGLADFAVTSTPFTSDEKKELSTAKQTYAYAPVTASALVLAYKVFDFDAVHVERGPQVTDLKLTPALVAQIFTGQLVNWQQSAAMNALNPGHHFPASEFPFVRGDHSSENLLFTSWLTATAKSSLPKDWPGPSVDYPLQYLTQQEAVDGGDRLALAVAAPATVQANDDWTQVGYIGFMDASQAAYYGLPVAQIENASGNFVPATAANILAGISDETKTPDGTLWPNFATTDANAYPMPIVNYVTAPTDLIDWHKGLTLQAFLKYAVGDGQSSANLPAGYVPLPSNLVTDTTNIIPKIPNAEGEGSPPPPSPTPTPSPTPSGGGGDGSGYGSGSGSGYGSGSGTGTGTGTYPTGSGTGTTTPCATSPSPSSSPSPSPAASPSPTASGSGAASPSPSASPSPTPSATPAVTESPCATTTTATIPTLPTTHFTETAARLVLPSLAALGILGLICGLGMELAAKGGTPLSGRAARFMSGLPLPRWLRP